jgi:HTH-type transcriptional regulator, osmoprotectant uptake regulator
MNQITKEFNEILQRTGNPGCTDSLIMSIYAILYLESEPVAMEDLAKMTGYSLASVSSKTNIMETMGLIERRNMPRTRKLYYYMDKDLSGLFKNLFIKKEKKQIAVVKQMLPKVIEKYKKRELDEPEKKRLENLQKYYKSITKLEKIIKKIITMIDEQ